jgi:ABC-type multidrug transport system fused ATPase/permease subunit
MPSNPNKSKIKYAFLLLNAIWFVCGLVLVIIGTLLKINYKIVIGDGMDMVIKDVPNSTVMIFIIVGISIVFVSLLGNCGTAMNDTCMLYSYSFISILLLIVESIGIALAFNFSDRLESEALKSISKAIKDYDWKQNEEKNEQSAIDSLQNILKCCGAHNFSDWNLNANFNQTDYPYSCCRDAIKLNYSADCTIDIVNNTIGCVDAIENRLNHRISTLGGVSIAISIIQIIITIISCLFARKIREYESL